MEEKEFIMELTLPEDLALFVMERAKEEGYADPGGYVLALIMADPKRRDEQRLEATERA